MTEGADGSFEITRTLPCGHASAVLGTIKNIGLDRALYSRKTKERDLALALIVARIIAPQSKLATARSLSSDTAGSAISHLLGIEDFRPEDLYHAMDWLYQRQSKIEKALAEKHLKDGTLVLYDLTSTYFEGRHCPLAKLGYSRDGKKGTLQITVGLLCNADGCPIAVEVFDGNTTDSETVKSQLEKLKTKFGLSRLVFVGDRGMITETKIETLLRGSDGLDWITALRSSAIKKLIVQPGYQLLLTDEIDMGEITSPDYPDERLIVCRNQLLAKDRSRIREELLAATELKLEEIVAATKRERNPIRGKAEIGIRVGKWINKYKVGKHFSVTIEDNLFTYNRKTDKIDEEKKLDGIYVIRTSLEKGAMSMEKTVESYKSLASVERAFRSLKTIDLHVRPIFHRTENRVRAHVFLCMLAYYTEWHMRRKLKHVLFDDEYPEEGQLRRKSNVAPAQRSESAEKKVRTKTNDQGDPVHSFRTLLQDLGTIALNICQPNVKGASTFQKVTIPTKLQKEIFQLLGIESIVGSN